MCSGILCINYISIPPSWHGNRHNNQGILYFNMLSKHSLTIWTESRIYLPPIKAFWLEMSEPKICFILRARTLAKILYTLSTRLIGLKFLATNYPIFLGIRPMKVAFKLLKQTMFMKSMKMHIRSSFTIAQHDWKKAILNPSGPSALPLSILSNV